MTTAVLLVLGLLTAFGPLSIDMYLPALPEIARDLGAPLSSVQLSLSSYFIGIAAGQIFYGPVTDRFGRKKPLYVGLVIYAVASLLCATSKGVDALVAFRFLQAVGACAGLVISRAVVRDLSHGHESAKIFSLLMLIMGVAPILAPVAGGALLTVFGWRSIFWVLTLVSVFTIAAIAIYLKETSVPHPDHKLSNALKNYLSVFSDRNFLGYVFSLSFIYAGLFAYITGSPFVFIEHYGLNPGEYSVVFGVNAFGIIAFSQINGRLLRKYSPLELIKFALPLTAVAGVFLFMAGITNGPMWGLCVPLFFYVLSLGMIAPNASAAALMYQRKSAGSASALMGTIQFTVSAIASAAVSHWHNGTLVPMTVIMFVCALLALAFHYLLIRSRKTYAL